MFYNTTMTLKHIKAFIADNVRYKKRALDIFVMFTIVLKMSVAPAICILI